MVDGCRGGGGGVMEALIWPWLNSHVTPKKEIQRTINRTPVGHGVLLNWPSILKNDLQ